MRCLSSHGFLTRVFLLLLACVLPVRGEDPSCWQGPVNGALCCDTKRGPRGLEACWQNEYTYERCCTQDSKQTPENEDPQKTAENACRRGFSINEGALTLASSRLFDHALPVASAEGGRQRALAVDHPAGNDLICSSVDGQLHAGLVSLGNNPLASITVCIPIDCVVHEEHARWAALELYKERGFSRDPRVSVELRMLTSPWPALAAACWTSGVTIAIVAFVMVLVAATVLNSWWDQEQQRRQRQRHRQMQQLREPIKAASDCGSAVHALVKAFSLQLAWRKLVAAPGAQDVMGLHAFRVGLVGLITALHTAYLTDTGVETQQKNISMRCAWWVNPAFAILSGFLVGLHAQRVRGHSLDSLCALGSRVARAYLRVMPVQMSITAFFALVVTRLPLHPWPDMAWSLLFKRLELQQQNWVWDGLLLPPSPSSSVGGLSGEPWSVALMTSFFCLLVASAFSMLIALGLPQLGFFAGVVSAAVSLWFVPAREDVSFTTMSEKVFVASVSFCAGRLLSLTRSGGAASQHKKHSPSSVKPRYLQATFCVGLATVAIPVLNSAGITCVVEIWNSWWSRLCPLAPFALGVSIMLFALARGTQGEVDSFNRNVGTPLHLLVVLSRLGMGMAANHVAVLFILNAVMLRHVAFPPNILVWIVWSCFVWVCSCAVAVFQSLCFETPCAGLFCAIQRWVGEIMQAQDESKDVSTSEIPPTPRGDDKATVDKKMFRDIDAGVGVDPQANTATETPRKSPANATYFNLPTAPGPVPAGTPRPRDRASLQQRQSQQDGCFAFLRARERARRSRE